MMIQHKEGTKRETKRRQEKKENIYLCGEGGRGEN